MACEIIAPSPSSHPTRPQKIVISCFDKSTNMVKPWAEASYLCYCVDIQHQPGEKPNRQHHQSWSGHSGLATAPWPDCLCCLLPAMYRRCCLWCEMVQGQGHRITHQCVEPLRCQRQTRRMVRSSVHDREPREHCLDLLAETGLHI